MELNRRMLDKVQKLNTTAIFEGISVVGDLKGSQNLYLNGGFEGTIDLTALLLVGKTGRLKGEVKAECVIIEGEVEGKVIANKKVEIRDGGKYTGEILAPAVLISDNAFFEGNVKMMTEAVESPVLPFTEKPKAAADDESP
ncbi:polymer-forming cytoskeletal protein [candidate division KSB1 bacterium]|nr:polymer-forming cytoskeletal protein [candidate division KSB1 bacterium]